MKSTEPRSPPGHLRRIKAVDCESGLPLIVNEMLRHVERQKGPRQRHRLLVRQVVPPNVVKRNVRRSILYSYQIKPLRRGDLATTSAIAGGECGGEIVDAPFALADVNQRADHRAHLMVQERARRG